MLYLKYRPQKISELDLSQVRNRVEQILKSNNIPHAMLFSGPKGTGKTSTARIMAKALNCEKNKFASNRNTGYEPCNICSQCKMITRGANPDIVEMDGASNRKIDDIRDLIENIKFAPITSRNKFYIIDEIHMLTKEAFNALLKTLEEPPKNTYFVLATTEPDELPATVRSRCYEISFQKATDTEILTMLNRVAKSEKITSDDKTLLLIASYSDGSFRDATKIFEEAINNNILSYQGILAMLSIAQDIPQLLTYLDSLDEKKAIQYLKNIESKGVNLSEFIKSVLNELYLLLLSKYTDKSSEKIKYSFTLKQIALLMRLFQEAYVNLKTTPIEIIPLEIAVIEYFNNNSSKLQ
jgi:DNA polymerase III subunit gamma/tau